MLRLAGRLSAGTAIWVGGPRYVAEAAKAIGAAAREAGRPAPRVLASVPVCVTDHAKAVREAAASFFARYGQLAVLPGHPRQGRGRRRGGRRAHRRRGGGGRSGIAAFAKRAPPTSRAALFTPAGEDAARTLAFLATAARDAGR